ncbi:hypothetical protein SUNI508_10092 [Seiridium unicorne]|uniref:Zn(2)-C6 fungal-type domain-containing protein n=1 Tax=Seiridium unicorne TaxID=138068 RepID=A0ABR2UMC8_9PEZI
MAKSNGQRAACDRCRGQKLKCSWAAGEPQCKRCQRADVVCTVPQARPMGRPSRQYRGSGSSSTQQDRERDRERERENAIYSWSDEASRAAASGDEDTSINMNPTFAPPESLDFLPWFPDSDSLNLFAFGGPAVTTPPLSNPNLDLDVNRLPSVQNDMSASVLMASAGSMQLDPMQMMGMGANGPGSMGKGNEEQTQLLTRLCDLNVALFQHALSRDNNPSTSSSQRAARRGESPTQMSAAEPPADNNTTPPWDLSVSDLGIGKLLHMTYELKEIMPRIWQTNPEGHDRSTTLLALSCYTRLEILYSRSLDILLAVRNGEQQLRDVHLLTPGLSVDGFSLARCADLQLHFVIQLYQQTHTRIRNCIKSGCGIFVPK